MDIRRIILLAIVAIPTLLLTQTLGDYYASQGHYFEAITEYKRQLFLREYSSADKILYKIGSAYYSGGKTTAAETPLLEALGNPEQSTADIKCLLLLAKIHWDNYDYEALRNTLDYLAQRSPIIAQSELDYIKAWSYFYEAQWQAGLKILDTLEIEHKAGLIRSIAAVDSVPQKSKKLALIMSTVFPGSGQLYAGDYKNAIFSFLLVGSIAGSMVWNICQQAYFIAVVKYLFLYTRYAKGGLRHLARHIDRQNIDRIGAYLKKLAEDYPEPMELLSQMQKQIELQVSK